MYVRVHVGVIVYSERRVYTMCLSVGVGITSCTNLGARKQISSTCVHVGRLLCGCVQTYQIPCMFIIIISYFCCGTVIE